MPDQVRSIRTEHWFFIGNAIIDNYGSELGVYGIALYTTLCRFASNDRQDCFPSHETLATRTSMSKRQVIRVLKQLEELGLIKWNRQYTEAGKQMSNLYLLLDPPGVGVTVSHTRGDCESHKQDSCKQDSTEIPAQAQNITTANPQTEIAETEIATSEKSVEPEPSRQEVENDQSSAQFESLFGAGQARSPMLHRPPRTEAQIKAENARASVRGMKKRNNIRALPSFEAALKRYGDGAPALRALQAEIDNAFGLAPDWSSKKQVKSWVTGLKELWTASGEDHGVAVSAGKRLRDSGMTISSPRSLVNTARAIAAERAMAKSSPATTARKEWV